VTRFLLALVLLGVGAALSLAHGRLAFMPLDQSIVFDGGWRLLSGQVPFRDFTTPAGLAPIGLQAAFFSVLGVDWLAYLLHAALVNGCFCLTVFALLREFGGSHPLSFFYALLSGFLLYPPIGTPYLEPHAFFFLLLAGVLLAIACRSQRTGGRALLCLLVVVCWTASFASKQNVAAFGVLLLASVLALRVRRWRELSAFAGWGAASLLLVALGLVAVGRSLGVDAELFRTYFFELPYGSGQSRVANLPRVLAAAPLRTATVSPVAVVGLMVGFGVAALLRRAFGHRASARLRASLGTLWLATSLVLTCVLASATMFNATEIGFPYVVAALGLAHLACASWLGERFGRSAALSAGAAFAAIASWDAGYFHTEVNAKRIVHDLVFDPRLASRPRTPELWGMVYQAPDRYGTTAKDLDDVLGFLRSRPENFVLIGDHSILYGLAGKPSVPPSLWFHKGLTLPEIHDAEHPRYLAAFDRNLDRYAPRYLVLEGQRTWMGSELRDFPRLRAAAADPRNRRFSFGGFSVVDLGPAAETRAPSTAPRPAR